MPVPGLADRDQKVLRLESQRGGQALAAEALAPGGVEGPGGLAVLDREPDVVPVPPEAHPCRPVSSATDQLRAPGGLDQCHRGAETAELPVGSRRSREPE